ncbi:hypothetical protein ZIOFF_006938 [Zingiber officinale]|uniref:Uncharacterized protein n=1 Tax=Zingiber officinale TaxID=94328 RepID=A0A8J5HQC2_ZINOF|nr:hypothetical protein ZIOFF_006938 [Zingiber officinale]
MAALMARSGLRSASLLLRQGAKSKAAEAPKRSFSASAHDDASEAAKWEKIAYGGIFTCTILSIYNLSKGHPHYEETPAYTYLHIRNKEFPWGLSFYPDILSPYPRIFAYAADKTCPDGLFEAKHHDH